MQNYFKKYALESHKKAKTLFISTSSNISDDQEDSEFVEVKTETEHGKEEENSEDIIETRMNEESS